MYIGGEKMSKESLIKKLKSLGIRKQVIERMARSYVGAEAKKTGRKVVDIEDTELNYYKRKFYKSFEEMPKEKQDKRIDYYLSKHEKLQKQVIAQKRLRIKLATIGTIGLIGGMAFTGVSHAHSEEQEQKQIEQIQELGRELEELADDNEDLLANKIQELEENNYEKDNWKQEIEEEIDELDSESKILNYTKKIGAEGYNLEHANEPIEAGDLQIIYTYKTLEVKKDKFGNITGYRETNNPQGETASPRGYIFSINGKKVAYYLEDGTEVESNEYEQAESCFKELLPILETSRDAQNAQRWNNSQYDKDKAKEEYKEAVIKLEETRRERQKEKQQVREEEQDDRRI